MNARFTVLLAGLICFAAFAQTAPSAGEAAATDGGIVAEANGGEAVAPLMQTVVVGESAVNVRRIAGSAQVISQEELARGESNDVHRVLQSVPGVYVREEDGFGLRPNIGMRGVNPDRSSKVTLMEDGVLAAPAPYSAPAAYNFPLMTRMTSVEIFKGPASIRYGPQTIGGAINLLTAPVPAQTQADLDVSLGNYGQRKVHGSAALANDRFGVLGEVVHLGASGFKVLPSGADTGFSKTEGMLKGRAIFQLEKVRHALELKAEYGVETSNETYLGLSFEDFARAPYSRYAASAQDRMKWWRSQLHLRWTANVGDNVEVRAVVYRNDFQRNWHRFLGFRDGPDVYTLLAYPARGTIGEGFVDVLAGRKDSETPAEDLLIVDNFRRMHAQGVQTGVTVKATTLGIEHELEAGLRVHEDAIRRSHFAHGYRMTSGELVSDGLDEVVVTSNLGQATALAGYATDTLRIGHLLLAPGVRVEAVRVNLDDYVTETNATNSTLTPLVALGGVYELTDSLSALAGVHQGFSPVAPGSGADAKPERAVNTEAGVRYGRGSQRFEAVGFWSEYSNITAECSFAEGCSADSASTSFSGGAARVLGVELLGSWRTRLTRETKLYVDGAYTFTQAHFLTSFSSSNPSWGDVSEGDELPYVPVHQGQLRARAEWRWADLGLSAMYYGEFRELAGTGEIPDPVRVPARVLLGATAGVTVDALRVYATANNLRGTAALTSRRPFGARPEAPLLFQVGVKYAFR